MPKIMKNGLHYAGNIFDSQPIGEIIQCDRNTDMAGYIELGEERKSVLRESYPELFKEIGTTYGAEDEEHFNLPSKYEIDDRNAYANIEFDKPKVVGRFNGVPVYQVWKEIPVDKSSYTGSHYYSIDLNVNRVLSIDGMIIGAVWETPINTPIWSSGQSPEWTCCAMFDHTIKRITISAGSAVVSTYGGHLLVTYY